jgi:cytochrome c biogenesis protein CcdA
LPDERIFTFGSRTLKTPGQEQEHQTTIAKRKKEAIMATGISLFFLAIGAILTFAVHTAVQGVDLSTIGVILMVIGLLGMLFSLVLWDSWSPRPVRRVDDDVMVGRRDVVIDDEAPVRRTVTRRVYR